MQLYPTARRRLSWPAALLLAAAADALTTNAVPICPIGSAHAQGTAQAAAPAGLGGVAQGLSLTPVFGEGADFSGAPFGGLVPDKEQQPAPRGLIASLRAEAGLTLTDNVNLQPSGQEKSDLVTEVRPVIGLSSAGSRVKFDLAYAPTAYVYARSTDDNNVSQRLDANLSAEVLKDFLYIDTAANIADTYISAFAPRPESGSSATDNRTQQTTLRLSPYIARKTDRDWDYLIRNDTYWNMYDNAALDDSMVDRVTLGLRAPSARVRTEFDYTYLYTKYQSQADGFYQQVGRVRPILAVTSRLKMGPRIGYESNDYGLTHYSGSVYGGELAWNPSPRTQLSGFLEHRFFGESYGLNFSHRSRRTVWSLNGTRDTYTSIDQTLNLAPGNTASALDDALRASIPDSAERARAVQQFLSASGLPSNLSQYYTFYSAQIYRAEQWGGSVALLGRRNTVEVTAFWQDNKPITGDGGSLPLYFANANTLKQKGGRVALIHKLTPLSSVTFTAGRLYSQGNGTVSATGASAETTEDTLRLTISHQLAPRTQGSVGARWVDSSGASSYQEHAVFLLATHTF